MLLCSSVDNISFLSAPSRISRHGASFFTQPYTTNMTTDAFKIAVDRLITAKASEIIASKPEKEQYLNWSDMRSITSSVKDACFNHLGEIPKQIEVACNMSEAILAPMDEKIVLLKNIIIMGGGIGGIAAIIGAIGLALGWGAGVISTVITFFTGTALLGPLGWAVGGVTLLVIAGYFALSGSPADDSSKALTALHKGVEEALTEYFKENAHKLHD